eukprot:scaffold169415_cov24-Tisochrysis_lutea.AAC.1
MMDTSVGSLPSSKSAVAERMASTCTAVWAKKELVTRHEGLKGSKSDVVEQRASTFTGATWPYAHLNTSSYLLALIGVKKRVGDKGQEQQVMHGQRKGFRLYSLMPCEYMLTRRQRCEDMLACESVGKNGCSWPITRKATKNTVPRRAAYDKLRERGQRILCHAGLLMANHGTGLLSCPCPTVQRQRMTQQQTTPHGQRRQGAC